MANHQARGSQQQPQPQKPQPLVRWIGAYRGEDGKYRVLATSTVGVPPETTLVGGIGDLLEAEQNLKIGMVTKVIEPLENEA